MPLKVSRYQSVRSAMCSIVCAFGMSFHRQLFFKWQLSTTGHTDVNNFPKVAARLGAEPTIYRLHVRRPTCPTNLEVLCPAFYVTCLAFSCRHFYVLQFGPSFSDLTFSHDGLPFLHPTLSPKNAILI